MFETTIQPKPAISGAPGMTPEKLVEELGRGGQGARPRANLWVPPIRNRIDMLATGIKSPIGVKVSGDDLAAIDRAALIEQVGARRAGRRLGARRAADRRPRIDVQIDRAAARAG